MLELSGGATAELSSCKGLEDQVKDRTGCIKGDLSQRV